jgi:hypothetical protein
MTENHEPIWFNNEPRNTEKKKAGYSLFVATPVHSEVLYSLCTIFIEITKLLYGNKQVEVSISINEILLSNTRKKHVCS